MKSIVRTYETDNHIYKVGYGIMTKTSFEQQREQRRELIYMTCQKLLGSFLIAANVIPAIHFKNIMYLICFSFLSVIGFGLVFTKQHIIG